MTEPEFAILLDRDGTIIVDKHYAYDPRGIELIDGAIDGLRRLQRAGFRLFVITNQSGVARGYFRESDVWAMHRRLDEILRQQGVRIRRYLYCPHHPDGAVDGYGQACFCRKPNPGLIWQANADRSLDLSRSWVIGDAPSDVLAGLRAGCRTVLLAGRRAAEAPAVPVDFRARDLREAAELIVREARGAAAGCLSLARRRAASVGERSPGEVAAGRRRASLLAHPVSESGPDHG